MPIQAEQPADTAADTIRQQDQRTPQAAPDPHQLLQDAAQHDQSPGQRGAPQRPPVLRHVPSPLLSPSPTPNTARRSGRESPLTPKLPSHIPGAPEAAARAGASLSYAAALRRSQTALEGAAAASADSGVVGSAGAGAGDAGAPTGSKASVFKVGLPWKSLAQTAPCWGAHAPATLLEGCVLEVRRCANRAEGDGLQVPFVCSGSG